MKWRNAVLVFALGAALCGVGVYISVAHQADVDELVATGRRVPATVTETRYNNPEFWAQIKYRIDGELYTVRLRSLSYTKLPHGETVLVYVDPNDPRRATTAGADATFTPPVGQPGLFGLGAGVTLVYLGVALTGIWRDKWARS